MLSRRSLILISCFALRKFAFMLLVGLMLTSIWTPTFGQQTSLGSISIMVRDVKSGYSLPAIVSIWSVAIDGSTGPLVDSFVMPIGLEVLRQLAAGKYIIRIEVEGYQPLISWFAIEAAKIIGNRYMMTPIEQVQSPELRLNNEEETASNTTMISGYVTDDNSGIPLKGVRITFQKTRLEVQTDEHGRYEALIPISESLFLNDRTIMAVQEVILFSLPGYKVLKEINVLLMSNRRVLKSVTLFKGVGEIVHDRTHPLLFTPETLKQLEQDKRSESQELDLQRSPPKLFLPQAESSPLAALTSQSLQVLIPPGSIRVGFSSTGGSCAAASCDPSRTLTFLLEEYVRLGWGDEWLASWGVHALRSGAVAYRSYAAKHVFSPDGHSGSNFDICSSASCQVFNSDDEGLTPAKTAGIMLQKGGTVFEAEYSAENNNFPCSGGTCTGGGFPPWTSCGDGSVGRPPTWPCLPDNVRTGQTLSGHGGGASQWGTRGWELQGRSWAWMINHYYNANAGADGSSAGQRNAFMTSPIKVGAISVSSNSVLQGQAFQINVTGTNHAGLAHTQIMIGASLSLGTTTMVITPYPDYSVSLHLHQTERTT